MAKKASERVCYYENQNGPVIGTVSRKIIEKDGMYFKDIDGSGEFKSFDDWRLPAKERAKEYVKTLTTKEKIAQLFISDWRMGKYTERFPEHKPVLDESGILDDAEFHGKTIFGEQHLPGTTELIKEWFARHLILRDAPTPKDMTDWINQLHAVAEECEHFIPVQVVSNSRNENGELVFGMNDAGGVFASWPGTLGIAAAIRGDSLSLADEFADCIRREWDSVGMKKGYMYMADVVSDPRWQRSYGTFGEDPQLICDIFERIIPVIQGSKDGVTPDGVAMTVKHFPGGGARENGFAYNKPFIDGLLRKQMGFQGYINSDTGIVHNMDWGVEMLDEPERIGFAVTHAGVDLISGLFDQKQGQEAYDRAVIRTMTELFALGMFENPYRDPKKAEEVIKNKTDWERAMDAHRKSVVLLKNDGVLPIRVNDCDKKKVYAECFNKDLKMAEQATKSLREQLEKEAGIILTESEKDADIAILLLNPSSGAYFSATPGYLELDLCEDKEVCNVDEEGRPTQETHLETTLSGVNRISQIAENIHSRGGKVITNVNITLAWEVGNVEPYCDAFIAGFDTYVSATLDVIFGRFAPTGKLPVTLPKGDEVLAVNAEGVCISPNDVPGYDKDRYLPDELKDENGKGYAYRDSAGNYYELDFGLRYDE